ncbi:MAG: CDP-diacylglycerol--glycerol-3-phosphate 3-phosphatidyltransferase [Zetaproteobacteria bacterium]|nr:MAG: CDP-diacylglycerol--glycerol-3-phosphate 3-phosphatidyltransferase [Zetaproteobacteria bacterium]
MLWTLSNQLTVARVALIPVIVVLFHLPWRFSGALCAALFVVASLTDWLDGYLARSRQEATPFGRFLDPVADKLLVATVLVLLVGTQSVPALPAAIIIGREIAISALREWLAERAVTLQVSMLGKAKTAMQMIAITALLLDLDIFGINTHEAGLVLLWAAAALTIWSGYEYIKEAWQELMAPGA